MPQVAHSHLLYVFDVCVNHHLYRIYTYIQADPPVAEPQIAVDFPDAGDEVGIELVSVLCCGSLRLVPYKTGSGIERR